MRVAVAILACLVTGGVLVGCAWRTRWVVAGAALLVVLGGSCAPRVTSLPVEVRGANTIRFVNVESYATTIHVTVPAGYRLEMRMIPPERGLR